MTARLAKGQWVRVRPAGVEDDWCLAEVAVASTNAGDLQSVGLALDGAVRLPTGGMILGALPLLVDYKNGRIEGLGGEEYEIDVPSFLCAVASPWPIAIGDIVDATKKLKVVRELTREEFSKLREHAEGAETHQMGRYYPANREYQPASGPSVASDMSYFYEAEIVP